MNLSRLRLITFDVTNTLLKFRSAPGQQYGEIGAMYGILCDNDSLSANFKAHWRKMNQEHPNFGLNSGLGWEKWWKMIVKGTFKDSRFNVEDKKLDAIASHLIDVYKTSACWQPCYGTQALLSYLRNRQVTLGIISNFDPRLSTTLTNTKLRHFFHFVLTSYEVGIEKPDTKIFDKALQMSEINNIKPDECLHVGDTTALDYYGARNSGWNAVLIDDRSAENLKKKYPDIDIKCVFPSLYDLHKYLVKTDNCKLSAQSL
ncbi:unnamed protein product [Brassicogethes aeneus]|uniref:Rhythmically expressed gene 2 protein n=1 Tax=Brassicogethes aeneus TaxID=1431903 RepID=A0A9P0FCM3_BRAAE|nr:unnamed protein product [Brassicogethes aeneus]